MREAAALYNSVISFLRFYKRERERERERCKILHYSLCVSLVLIPQTFIPRFPFLDSPRVFYATLHMYLFLSTFANYVRSSRHKNTLATRTPDARAERRIVTYHSLLFSLFFFSFSLRALDLRSTADTRDKPHANTRGSVMPIYSAE